MALGLALALAVLLIGLSGLIGSGSGDQLMRELSLVWSVDDLWSSMNWELVKADGNVGTYLVVGLGLIGFMTKPRHSRWVREGVG